MIQKTAAQIRKAKAAHIAKLDRRRRRKIKGIWPVVDEAYKAWIRSLPCVVCYEYAGRVAFKHMIRMKFMDYALAILEENFRDVFMNRGGLTQCAHIGEVRGLGQRCSDRETGPLCGTHHDRGQPEGHHDMGVNFWDYHGIDREELIQSLNKAWEGHLPA